MRFVFTCPKCNMSEFHPDIDKTKDYYSELYNLGSEPVSLLNEDPPFRPEKIIMICENLDCQHEEKYTTLQIAESLRDIISDYVWADKKRNRPEELFYLEDVLVQHFQDRGDIDVSDLKDNAYLRRLYHKAHGRD